MNDMRLNGMEVCRKRIIRIQSRTALKFSDLRRTLAWHIGGGCDYYERHASEIIAAHKWCFIVGCNNSGTTLLQDLLEKTQPVSTLPHEGQHYTNTLCRASRRGHERVWTEFINDLQMSSDDSIECIPRLLHDWLREYQTPRKLVMVEKTTANAVRMPWLQKAFPNSYFIGLVRNGYAVTEGILRKGQKSIRRGARHWNSVNKIMLHDAAKIQQFLTISYEEMTIQPYACLQKIAQFLDLELTNLADNTVVNPILAGIRNMNAESITRLSQNDLKTVQQEANEMLRYFGYEPSVTDEHTI